MASAQDPWLFLVPEAGEEVSHLVEEHPVLMIMHGRCHPGFT
jgi:hypothetical protein